MLTLASIGFLFVAAFVFWVGVFVFSSNPFSKISRLGSLLLLDLSCFLLIGYLLFGSSSLSEYRTIFKYGSFPLMFAPVIWLHISLLTTQARMTNFWKIVVPLGYVLAILYYLGFAFSNLIVDFDILVGPVGRFAFIFKSGPLFYPTTLIIITYFALAFFNFYKNFRENKILQATLPLVVSIMFIFGWLVVIASYIFRYNSLIQETGEFIISASVIVLAALVIFNRLFLDGTKTNLNKEFIFSTIGIFAIIAVYLISGFLVGIRVSGLANLMLLALIIFLLVSSHTFYSWLISFIRNIYYERTLSLPRVTDEEVNEALRNLNKPEKLEKTTLLRLNILKEAPKFKLDLLRKLIKDSVIYFKPDDQKRDKANLKYMILSMIADQVEEGQILWDLGFEEYPLEIAEKSEGQKPRLSIERPTDYQATSRNAYISLKKEAIHDLAWRLSYLEKHA